MSETRTITIQVPAAWYAIEGHYDEAGVWEHTPGRFLGDEPVRDAIMAGLVAAALPRMQWGYLSLDVLTPCASEAQVRVRAWLRHFDDPDVNVVHRLGDGDWLDDSGLTYSVPAALTMHWVDVLATREGAVYWLHRAAQWAEGAWWLGALRREADAHGHDITALEG